MRIKKKKRSLETSETDTLHSVYGASASFQFSLLSGGYGFGCSWDYTETGLLRILFILHVSNIPCAETFFIIIIIAVLSVNRPVRISDDTYTVLDQTFRVCSGLDHM